MSRIRLFTFGMVFLLAAAGAAAQKSVRQELTARVDAEVEGALFRQTLAAVEIRDCATGAVLYARNADLLLRPASNTKLFTSAAALLGLPKDFAFRTAVRSTDSSRRALILTGGADPLLNEQDIQKLAEIAHGAGTLQLDTLFLDGSLFDDRYFGAGWMWDDEPDPFMPYLSAFPYLANTIRVTLKAPAKHGVPLEVRTFPSSAFIQIENRGLSGTGTALHVTKLPRSNRILVQGSLAAGRVVTKRLSLWQPEILIAEAFLAALGQRGVSTDSAVVLYRPPDVRGIEIGAVSRSLDPVLEEMNKESDNLCAEAVLRMLGRSESRGSDLSSEDGIKGMLRIFRSAGIPTDDIHLRDGSGISFYNLVSARQIGLLLTGMAGKPVYSRFLRSLAVANEDGTLKRRMNGLGSGTFHGKTGTVSGVSALSGYAQAPGGRLLSVVIMMQNFNGSHRPYRAVQDRIVEQCLWYSGQAAIQPR